LFGEQRLYPKHLHSMFPAGRALRCAQTGAIVCTSLLDRLSVPERHGKRLVWDKLGFDHHMNKLARNTKETK